MSRSRCRPGRSTLLVVAAIIVAAVGVAVVAGARASAPPPAVRHLMPSTPLRAAFDGQLNALAKSLDALDSAVVAKDLPRARAALYAARRTYKRGEMFITFYSPRAASALNGPAEEGDADAAPVPLGRMGGLQIVQEALETDPPDWKGAQAAVPDMQAALHSLREGVPFLYVADTAALDAARLEIGRVATLGLAGFDGAPDSAVVESADAFDGIAQTLNDLSGAAEERGAVVSGARAAAEFLRQSGNFEQINRLAFIVGHATPVANAVRALRMARDARPIASRRIWRTSAATIWEARALDPWAYSTDDTVGTAEQIAVGEHLFNDPRLSAGHGRACVTCHVPSRAFTDGLARPSALGHGGASLRNTPTLIDAALQPVMFADARANSVENQIRTVLSSPAEMGSSSAKAASAVGVPERRLVLALAAYVRSLSKLDSPFDRALRGDTAAMTAEQRRGFTLFMGKGQCATCHFVPLTNGTMPPDFVESELEIIGVPSRRVFEHASVDPDSGRGRIDGQAEHTYAFRVPSLRNVARTAPYMHNGVYQTLEEVVDFYNRGGGRGIGERLPAQTLSADPLHLVPRERADLVAFLHALSSEP